MTQDLLSREAVDRKLVDDALERTAGRDLVGLRFDSEKKAWYVMLKDGAETLVRLSSEVLGSFPQPGAKHRARHRTARQRKRK